MRRPGRWWRRMHPRRCREAALARGGGHHLLPPGVDRVGGGTDAVADIAEHMQSDLQLFRCVPGLGTRAAVEVDQWGESPRFAANDRNHQRQAEHAGAHERLRRAPNPDPDRQGVLSRTWKYALSGQGGAMTPGPLNHYGLRPPALHRRQSKRKLESRPSRTTEEQARLIVQLGPVQASWVVRSVWSAACRIGAR